MTAGVDVGTSRPPRWVSPCWGRWGPVPPWSTSPGLRAPPCPPARTARRQVRPRSPRPRGRPRTPRNRRPARPAPHPAPRPVPRPTRRRVRRPPIRCGSAGAGTSSCGRPRWSPWCPCSTTAASARSTATRAVACSCSCPRGPAPTWSAPPNRTPTVTGTAGRSGRRVPTRSPSSRPPARRTSRGNCSRSWCRAREGGQRTYALSNNSAYLQYSDQRGLILEELGDAPLETVFRFVDNGAAPKQ